MSTLTYCDCDDCRNIDNENTLYGLDWANRQIEELIEAFPKIEDIQCRQDGSLLLWSSDWLNNIIESYVENITNEEWYEICKTSHVNGINCSWVLKETR